MSSIIETHNYFERCGGGVLFSVIDLRLTARKKGGSQVLKYSSEKYLVRFSIKTIFKARMGTVLQRNISISPVAFHSGI